jgi:hypothetical protein
MDTMETYPIFKEEKDNRPYAFEVENAYVRPVTIARLLKAIDGVSNVRARGIFHGSSEIHIEFRYLDQDYMVWEPYGDNSRYWIGPKDAVEDMKDISQIESVFKKYQLPFWRQILGDILSLKLFKFY